jgi:hypothetical protein
MSLAPGSPRPSEITASLSAGGLATWVRCTVHRTKDAKTDVALKR